VSRLIETVASRLDSPRVAWIGQRVATYGLLVTFVILTGQEVLGAYTRGFFGLDLRIYRAAAMAVLQGGDPWSAGAEGFRFAATPPTLLAYIPAAVLNESVGIAIYGLATVFAAVFVVRRLELPIWWLLFPPLAESVIVLNPDVLVIALLLSSRRVAWLAVVLKIYAVIPLALQRRWVAVVVGCAASIVALPLWLAFLEQRGPITDALASQSLGGISAWGSWLVIPTTIALLILRGRGAAWLVVPALWPFTQLHYATIAMPAARRSPTLAFLLSFAIPMFPAYAVIVEATRVVLARLLDRYRSGDGTITPSSPGGPALGS
jgi:hypothetical protein